MILLRGIACSDVWCSILFSDATCAGNIAGFDAVDTAGAESIAVLYYVVS